MLIRVPDYYDAFHCLAGACPHSCCEKWEVVIDEGSAHRYEEVSGPLGEKLRYALQQDADGDLCFALNGGRCPFLDAENLCEIHRKLGEEATSITCREHPRFTEDYGYFREITLSASCPAVNDLLLGSRESLTFLELETDEVPEEWDAWTEEVLEIRQELLEVMADRTQPWQVRLGRFLAMAAERQAWLEEEPVPACSVTVPELPEDTWTVLLSLEQLEESWRELLHAAKQTGPMKCEEELLERIGMYFAFRYLLKCVNDGDLWSRAQFVVFAVLTVECLATVCGLAEALRRFSCEIEHSDANLEFLLERFREGTLCVLPYVND